MKALQSMKFSGAEYLHLFISHLPVTEKLAFQVRLKLPSGVVWLFNPVMALDSENVSPGTDMRHSYIPDGKLS
jgi:hypothetical protein